MENTFKNVVMMQRIIRVRFKCEKVTYTTVEALSWKSETLVIISISFKKMDPHLKLLERMLKSKPEVKYEVPVPGLATGKSNFDLRL